MHLETHFTAIRPKVLELLQSATESIQLAVAWFTDQKLYDALLDRLEAGVSVTVLIRNDYVNNHQEALDWQYFVDNKGILYFASDNEPLHHKFCIIDNKNVIHGSYNWTYSAAFRNLESCVFIQDETVAQQFNNEITKVINSLSNETIIKRYIMVDDGIEIGNQLRYVEQEKIIKTEIQDQSQTSTDSDYLLQEAFITYNNKKYINSIELAKEVLRIKPDSEKAFFCLAGNYYRMERYGLALENALHAINASDTTNRQAEVWNLLGLVNDGLKNHLEAVRCYDKAINIDSHTTTWYYNKYWSLYDAKASSQVIDKVRLKVLEVSRHEIINNKNNIDMKFLLMKCHAERGKLRDDIPEARKDANKALEYYESLAIDEQDLHDLDMIMGLQKELK